MYITRWMNIPQLNNLCDVKMTASETVKIAVTKDRGPIKTMESFGSVNNYISS